MDLVEKHYRETKIILDSLHPDKIAEWLLNEGYYPEQYVFPPNFKSKEFELKTKPYHNVSFKKGKKKSGEFAPVLKSNEILNISYPKTELTDRIFGIYHPENYHDIVWYLHKNWKKIINHLYPKSTKIFSYSFPIPMNCDSKGEIGSLRAGRMIYEYLELAEKDLLAESYKYKFLLKTDIKNFYPSIYTHSVAWAIHTKKLIRENNEKNLRLFGNILDCLIQYANDRKTNGIPIGPAISDLIAEIILTSIDRLVSQRIKRTNFIAARFKDDYFFLIESEEQAQIILSHLQAIFKEFNLFINEEKTKKYSLPDGLLRPWIIEFDKIWNSIKSKSTDLLSFQNFIMVTQEVLNIDAKYPNTGLIEKYLSKLTNNKNNYALHIDFESIKNQEQALLRAFSLLIHLSKRSKKSFPSVLGVLESIIRASNKIITDKSKTALIEELIMFSRQMEKIDDEHKKIWWIYFILSNSVLKSKISLKGYYKETSVFLKSFQKGSQMYFNDFTDCRLFDKVSENPDFPISKYLDVFNRE